MKIILKLISLTIALTIIYNCSSLAGNSLTWQADYNTALESAKQSQKPIYLVFVNDHSCPRCKFLNDNILSKKDFKSFANDNLILLKVDYGAYFKSDKKITFQEIETKAKVPKDFWMKGRTSWPYLFLISPDNQIKYSGSALANVKESKDYITFLKDLMQ